MDLNLTAEQEQRMAQLAVSIGCDQELLAREAVSRYLDEESRFVEIVKLGEAELDRGEYLSHEQAGASIDRIFLHS